VVKIIDHDKDFIVCIDISSKGWVRLQMQENFLVAFESQKLKDHEGNYAVYELKLGMIINTLKMWRIYLIGTNLTLINDHMSLKYFFS